MADRRRKRLHQNFDPGPAGSISSRSPKMACCKCSNAAAPVCLLSSGVSDQTLDVLSVELDRLAKSSSPEWQTPSKRVLLRRM